MSKDFRVAALLLVVAHVIFAQGPKDWPMWQVRVVDSEGAAIQSAHVYVHNMGAGDIRPDGDAAVTYVADSTAGGELKIPASVQPRDLLVFASGFKPWVGFLDSGPSSKKLEVKMQVIPCDYPGVVCDTFGTGAPKRRKR